MSEKSKKTGWVEFFKNGVELKKKGEYAKAIEAFKCAIEISSDFGGLDSGDSELDEVFC